MKRVQAKNNETEVRFTTGDLDTNNFWKKSLDFFSYCFLTFAQTLRTDEKKLFTDKLTKSKKNPHFSTQVTFWKCCAFICSIFLFFSFWSEHYFRRVWQIENTLKITEIVCNEKKNYQSCVELFGNMFVIRETRGRQTKPIRFSFSK